MSGGSGLRDFPDVEAKLQKPPKQSAFERQRAEAEAKRQREAAETAAVYEDFVKSFDRDEDDPRSAGFGASGGGGFGGSAGFGGRPRPGAPPPSGPGASRRHFGASSSAGPRSGPGSLGPALPQSSGFGKKRSFQDFARGPADRAARGIDEHDGKPKSVSRAFDTSDDEDAAEAVDRAAEKAIARPTLRLTNLPPGTSPSLIKALIPANLVAEYVKILPLSNAAGTERKCAAAIVTLSQETPANEIDTAVSSLQHRYLGYGFYLSLHRHLSSAVINANALHNVTSSTAGSHPFNAKPVEAPAAPGDHHHAQPGLQRGYAPPSSYDAVGAAVNRANILHVPVRPPQDVRTIQAINKVIEGLLAHGPEFEALLLSRPDVQRDEKWAWIWDARSEGGIWYRWRLWEVVTGAEATRKKGKFVPLFDGAHAWKTPDKRLPFEYSTNLEDFVSDSDYNSSDDEDVDPDGARENPADELEKTFLNPLGKAKLTHLLARLPTTLSRVRKGDIARVTTFAIMHSSRGADEVVDLIVSNVEKPFSQTGANLDKPRGTRDALQNTAGGGEELAGSESQDVSAASLVGLYVVSDILSSSSTSGVRHAWRFRQLFETVLRDRRTFEKLGLMPENLRWGRLRAEKWKRSVSLVLNLWEGWCVFPTESQESFARTFESPPSQKAEEDKGESEDAAKRGKWKVVDASQAPEEARVGADARGEAGPSDRDGEDVEGEPIDEGGEDEDEDDVAGEPIEEDDVEGEPIEEDDIAGEPIEDYDVAGEPMDEDEIDPPAPVATMSNADPAATGQTSQADQGGQGEETRRGPARRRPRAVDMFADSDGSGKE